MNRMGLYSVAFTGPGSGQLPCSSDRFRSPQCRPRRRALATAESTSRLVSAEMHQQVLFDERSGRDGPGSVAERLQRVPVQDRSLSVNAAPKAP